MSAQPPQPAASPEPAGRLKLREALGHRWWGFVLAINFFVAPMGALALARLSIATSPILGFAFWLFIIGGFFTLLWFLVFVWKREPRSRLSRGVSSLAVAFTSAIVAYLIARSTTLPELTPLFWHFVLVLLGAVAVFWLFVRVYARTAYRLKVGDELIEEVDEERWRRAPLLERADALWHGIIRLEFFGWVIWVTAAVAAVGGALRNPPGGDPSFAHLSVLHQYFHTLDVAAYDLIRASVVGTIVLFFVQLLKTYQDAIVAAGKAAKEAEQASERAMKAVSEADKIAPTLERQMSKALDLFKSTGNILKADMIASTLGHMLRLIADSRPALGQVSEFSDKLFDHIGRINREVTHAYRTATAGEPVDPFDLVSLSAIYTTYLKVESLSFEGEEEVGRGGFRLATRYPHYVLAVRGVVEAIRWLDDDPERYRFYTLFSREPDRFFNPKPGESTNINLAQIRLNWTVLFLERFCRWHRRNDIFYKRHFITCSRRGSADMGATRIPPLNAVVDEQLEDYMVLCNVRGGKVRPCLWGETAWEFFGGAAPPAGQSVWAYLSEAEARGLWEDIAEVLPAEEVRNALKTTDVFRQVKDAAYVIVEPGKKGKFEAAIKPHAGEVELRPLKEVLLEYHSLPSPPAKLIFDDYNAYAKFFGDNLPRDLLAVWDAAKKCWCLCIGTMVGEHDPNAVVMVATTKERPLNNLPWSDLEKSLTDLFVPEPAGPGRKQHGGVAREEIA